MKTYTIRDLDGPVLYQRHAPSQKLMIQRLVEEGFSLARADLRDADLEHLNLELGDFTGANLDGARMTGARAKRARFDFASMSGTVCDGMSAPNASFMGAVMFPHPVRGNPTSFVGSNLPFTSWDNAKGLKVDWTRSDVCSSSFVGAHFRRCVFRDAEVRNVDWVDSRQYANDMGGAQLAPRMKNTPERFLPDRTRDAIVVGNSYAGAMLGERGSSKAPLVDSAFLWDRRLTRLKNHLSMISITAGIIGVGSLVEFDVDGLLQGNIGSGVGFLAAASIAVLAKDRLEDWIKDKASDRLNHLDAQVRNVVLQTVRRGKALSSIASAFVSSRYADALRSVMHEPEKSVYARFKAVVSGDVDLLICDRKQLAEALSRLSEALNGRFKADQDIVLMRTSFAADGYDAPSAVVLKPDGRVKAVWASADGTVHRKVEWDGAGIPVQANEDIRYLGPFNGHRHVLKAFADAVVAEAGVPEFDWNPATHVVRRGRNDSIVVLKKKDSRMDNPDGPAIVSRDDEMYYFRNSSQVDEFGEWIGVEDEAEPPRAAGMR